MKSLSLNVSYKHHLTTGLLLAVWLVGFLVFFAPFDIGHLTLEARLQLMPGYGVIAFVGYVMLVPLQNSLYRHLGQWNTTVEIGFLTVFNLLMLIGCYGYYQTEWISGTYSFIKFTFGVYYPIFFVVLPILLLSRWYLIKKSSAASGSILELTGENKLDLLRLHQDDLITVSSASNYVEVTYFQSDRIKKKLLRTSLKDLHLEVPHLVQSHRSHLINPHHITEWKDAQTLIVAGVEVPVSKNFRQVIVKRGISASESSLIS